MRISDWSSDVCSSDLNLMRRQAVCAITPGSHAPQPVFRELYISIADLQQSVLPEFDLASNLWLFQHLTQTLDSRMLSMLVRNDDSSIASSFSINLNVGTILSPPFLNFDSSLKAIARGDRKSTRLNSSH